MFQCPCLAKGFCIIYVILNFKNSLSFVFGTHRSRPPSNFYLPFFFHIVFLSLSLSFFFFFSSFLHTSFYCIFCKSSSPSRRGNNDYFCASLRRSSRCIMWFSLSTNVCSDLTCYKADWSAMCHISQIDYCTWVLALIANKPLATRLSSLVALFAANLLNAVFITGKWNPSEFLSN